MNNRPFSVSVALIFIVLNALVWLALGIIIAANAHPAMSVPPIIKGAMAFLSITATAVLLGLFFFLGKRSRIAYFLTLAFLAVASLLTIFDQFGWSDLVVLIINLIPMFLLIKDRRWYLSPGLQPR